MCACVCVAIMLHETTCEGTGERAHAGRGQSLPPYLFALKFPRVPAFAAFALIKKSSSSRCLWRMRARCLPR
jgi:hypothetical protein